MRDLWTFSEQYKDALEVNQQKLVDKDSYACSVQLVLYINIKIQIYSKYVLEEWFFLVKYLSKFGILSQLLVEWS